MKKRFLAFLLALSISASLLVMPASAAGSNAAVQAAVALGGMTTEQAADPDTPLTGRMWLHRAAPAPCFPM